jgi:hypothetical protein
MSWAGVPIVAVHEHRQSPAGEDDVGSATGSEAAVQSEPRPRGMQSPTQQHLRCCVNLATPP